MNEHYRADRTPEAFLEEALEAQAAGRHCAAEALFDSARFAERALELAGKPITYWAEGTELMVESRDGTGPCAVFQLYSGEYDMSALAEQLNRLGAAELTPNTSLRAHSQFVADSEYLSREVPAAVFCGDPSIVEVAQRVLNSVEGSAPAPSAPNSGLSM
jgi:hypothetical protein